MDRLDWYYRQLVTEGELDLAFDQVQERIESETAGTAFDGLTGSVVLSESSPTALTVEVPGDGDGYTSEGKHIAWSDPDTVDVSQDFSGTPTAVSTPGNRRWVSVFAEFNEDLQDLRLDGNGLPVYFKRIASPEFIVVQGVEGVDPPAPDLRPDALLLADVELSYGQTQVVDANIDHTRQQNYIRTIFGTSQWVHDNAREAIEGVLGHLSDLMVVLENQVAPSGADYVGIDAYSQTPTNGVALDWALGSVRGALRSIVDDLVASASGTNEGAGRVGSAAKTASIVSVPSPITLTAGNVSDQLQELADYLETIRNTPFAASIVSFVPHDYVTSTTVQAAINELIDDLQSQVGGAGNGSYEVGYKGVTQALTQTAYANMNLPAASVEATLDAIAARLAAMVQRSGGSAVEMNGDLWISNIIPLRFTSGLAGVTLRKENTAAAKAGQSVTLAIVGSDGTENVLKLWGTGAAEISGALEIGGNLTSDDTPSIGSSGNRFGQIWSSAIDAVSALVPFTGVRTSAATNTEQDVGIFKALTSADMDNDFGPALSFRYEDSSTVEYEVGRLSFVRKGGDDDDSKTILKVLEGGTLSTIFEAIATTMTIHAGIVIPNGDGAGQIGQTGTRWGYAFLDSLYVSKGTLEGVGDDLYPRQGATFDLGASTRKWDRVYANLCYGSLVSGVAITPTTASDLTMRSAQNNVVATCFVASGGTIGSEHFNIASMIWNYGTVSGLHQFTLDIGVHNDCSIIVSPRPSTIGTTSQIVTQTKWVNSTTIQVALMIDTGTGFIGYTGDFSMTIIGRPAAAP